MLGVVLIMEKHKPFIKDFVKFYYEDLGNLTGGYYHIVLDDGNVSDMDVWYCQEEAIKNKDSFGIFLGLILRMHTEEEREEMYNDNWGMR